MLQIRPTDDKNITYIEYHLWGEKSRKLGVFALFLYSIKILQLGHKTDGG